MSTRQKHIIIIITLLSLILILNVECYAKRYALVIGNGSYKNVPLNNPVNDASDIANILQELDFDVSKKTNTSRQEIINSIRDFENKITSSDVALFYYSGHGLQVNGINYIIPIGADINTENEVEFEAVAMNRIMSKLEKARINIIILDACRDNPYKGFRSAEKGLAILTSKTEGTFIAYSTAPGKVAVDGTGRNSPYTKNLIEKIHTLDLEIEDVFKEVRKAVKKETNSKQIPWDSSSLTDDFIFAMSSKPIESGTEVESKTFPPVEHTETKIFDKKPISLFTFPKAYPIGLSFIGNLEWHGIKEEHGNAYNKSLLFTKAYYFISKYLSIGGIFEWEGQAHHTNYNCIIPGFKYFFPKKDKLPFIIGNISLKNNQLDKDQTFEGGDITLNVGVDYYLSQQKIIEPSIYLIYNHHDVDYPQLDYEGQTAKIRIFYYNSKNRSIKPFMKYQLIEEFLNTKYFTEHGTFNDKGTFSLTGEITFSKSNYDFDNIDYETYSIYSNLYYYLLSNLSFNCGFTASHKKKNDHDFWDSEKICWGFRYFLSFNKVLPFAEIGYEYHSWKPEDTKRIEEYNAIATIGLDLFLSENIVVEPFLKHSTFKIGKGSETSHTIEYGVNIKTNFNFYK